MDFFAAQDLAKKRTKWMVLLFGLAVVCIACALYLVFVFASAYVQTDSEAVYSEAIRLWQPDVFVGTLLGVILLVGGCSLFKTAQLRSGGEYVARSLGGRKVAQSTTDADERKLLNIVEEMAIASGVPVPDVYLLEEPGINAFAAGFNPADAVVGVTRGCIQTLSRDELQGVVAHEFSHILNGDMRMNIRLMGILFGILVLAVIGQTILRGTARASYMGAGRRRSNKDNGGGIIIVIFLVSMAVMIIGYIGVFFGRLIQSAISRQREFLADASAVQFTRNPDGIAGALKKIGGSGIGGRLTSAHAQETAHFFFANAMHSNLLSSFATHPPLPKRIRAIDPNWDGKFAQHRVRTKAVPAAKASGVKGTARGSEDFIQSIGVLSAATIGQAHAIRQSLESELTAVHKSEETARAVLLALQVSASPATDDVGQLSVLKKRVDGAVYREAEAWVPKLRGLSFNQRFALLDAALPMAAETGVEGLSEYSRILTELAHNDGEINLEELAIVKTTSGFIDQRKNPSRRVAPMRPAEIEMPICVMLSAIVYTTGATGDAALAAFRAGAKKCNRYLLREPVLIPEDSIGFEALETALDLLAKLPNPQKRIIFEGALAVILEDGKVEEAELGVIRVIAASLGLPMPPLQAGGD